jgi:hypothetical protein
MGPKEKGTTAFEQKDNNNVFLPYNVDCVRSACVFVLHILPSGEQLWKY